MVLNFFFGIGVLIGMVLITLVIWMLPLIVVVGLVYLWFFFLSLKKLKSVRMVVGPGPRMRNKVRLGDVHDACVEQMVEWLADDRCAGCALFEDGFATILLAPFINWVVMVVLLVYWVSYGFCRVIGGLFRWVWIGLCGVWGRCRFCEWLKRCWKRFVGWLRDIEV